MMRMMIISTHPPHQPEIEPIAMPRANGMMAPMNPTASETLAPTQTLVQMSLPTESVPNQCWADGERLLSRRLVLSYRYGDSIGAKIAIRITARIRMTQNWPRRSSLNLRQTPCQ